MMTKELLEDYPHICAEIESLRRVERDVISMSTYGPPYVQHSQGIEGIVTSDMDLLMSLKVQKLEIEEFVRKLPNSELRRIVKMRAFQRLSWNDIAAKMGPEYSYKSVSCKYYRAVKQHCEEIEDIEENEDL